MRSGFGAATAALFAIIFSLVLCSYASALSCSVAQTCSTGIDIFNMYHTGNTHAAMPNYYTDRFKVCCEAGATLLNSSCSASTKSVILKLSNYTNAHVAEGTLSPQGYSYSVCLSSNDPRALSIDCNYKGTASNPANCDPGYTCLATISGVTNAHVADCTQANAYNIKVCCILDEDTAPPAVSADGDPADWTTQNVIATVACTDAAGESGCNTDSYGIWNSSSQPGNGCPTDYAAYRNASGGGIAITDYAWVCAAAKDKARNLGISAPVLFKVDKTPSTGGSISYGSGYENSQQRGINVTSGSDPQSGIKEIRIMKKEAVLQNGSCGTFDIAWSLGGTYSPAATEVEVPVSADKCYNFSMVVENNAGLTSAYYNSTIVKVDYVSPVTTDRIPAGWVSSPFYAELTCNDTGSGCDGTYYCKYRIGSQPASTCSDVNNWHRATALAQCASGTTCFQVDNDCNDGEKCNYSVSYYSIDRAGSQELANTVTARINKQDPSCDISLPPRYSKTSSITLSWSGSDPAQSGIKTYSIYYRNDSSLDRVLWLSTSSASGTFTGQANHTFTFTCEATNNLDQTGAPSQDRVVTIDSTPPYVAITGLPTWVNETSFELRWTATDFGTGSGIASYTPEYRVTNSTGIVSDWASLGNVLPPLTSATLAGMQSNYTYYFRVNATDNAGNNGTSAAMSTRADLELPVCNVGNLQGWVTASPFVISWSGTDNVSGIKSYTVQSSKDNFTTISTVGQEATNTTANIAVENGFTYYFRCIATDNALNTGVWSTAKTTNADLVKPAVTASYRQYVTTGGDQIINVTATDTNMDSLVLALDGSAVQPDFESVEDTMIISSWRLDNPSTGAHTFQLTATDKGGNTNRTSFSFSVAPCAEGAIRPCGSNNGVCRAGNQTCSNGQWGSCTGGVAPCNCSRSDAACLGSCVETCNNLDDDCDAQVDENLTQQCGSSIGRCQKGTQICAAGQWGQCQGGIGPASETCGNGLDDNCDGSIDEGCACTPGSTQPCGQSNTAPCHFGAQTCSSSGQWGTCAGAADPATEVCGNNADDDCDGQTDEGCACTGVDCGQNPSALPDWLSTALLAAGAVMLVVIVVLFLVFRKKGKELTWEEISKKWTGAKY